MSDWLTLWSEYGFADPESAGGRGAYSAQLRLAAKLADGRLDIESGVRNGHLRPVTTTDENGVETVKRYRLDMAGGVSE